MVTMMFSLFDTKAAMFNTPFFFSSRGQAIRAVMDLASDQNTLIARHPEDFVLYELGAFDDQNGVCSASRPDNLGTVVSFLAVPKRPVRAPESGDLFEEVG